MPPVATRIAQGCTLVWLVALAWSTAVAEISLGLALAALLVAALRGETTPWSELTPAVRRLLLLWGALAGWMLVAHAFALDHAAALHDLPKMYRFTALLPLTFLPWDRGFRLALYATLSGLALALAAEALPPFFRHRIDRVEAARLHYNTLAQYSASLSLILMVAAVSERRCAVAWRTLWGVAALAATVMLVGSLSRVAWFAWFTALPLIVLLAVPARRRWIFVAGALVVGAVAVSLGPVRHRLAEFTEFDDPHFLRRYDMWELGGKIIREDPLTGAGPSGVGLRYDDLKGGMLVDDPHRWVHLHDDAVTIAAYYGIPAAVFWVALGLGVYVLSLGWLLRGGRRPPPLAVGAALSIHVFFLCGMLHDTLPIYRKFAWYLLLWGLLLHASSRRAMEDPLT